MKAKKPNKYARELVDEFYSEINNYPEKSLDYFDYEKSIKCAFLYLKKVEDIHFKFYGQDKEFTMYLSEVVNVLNEF